MCLQKRCSEIKKAVEEKNHLAEEISQLASKISFLEKDTSDYCEEISNLVQKFFH